MNRTLAKIDQTAAKLARIRKKGRAQPSLAFLGRLRDHAAAGRPVEITVGGRSATIKPEDLRLSGLTLDLGRARVPLEQIETSEEETRAKTAGPCDFQVYDDDGDILPLHVAAYAPKAR